MRDHGGARPTSDAADDEYPMNDGEIRDASEQERRRAASTTAAIEESIELGS
jgi:hypothetical protein